MVALSSDEIIKREIIEHIGHTFNNIQLRIFPESSNDDQLPFDKGGLTFGINGVLYGSCDACWYVKEPWTNPYNNLVSQCKPIIALEGTDALNRGSSGNAQYQRFHHVLGAVKSGLIGVYYLKKGEYSIQKDLYGMAYNATIKEKGEYLIINDLDELKTLLSIFFDKAKLDKYLTDKINEMKSIFLEKFNREYKNWETFALKRSSIIKDWYVIKYSGRMKRNFTEGSQRAGHIAVGEMFLTKYFFIDKFVFYLWPKMTKEDILYLDQHKTQDKEWRLLRKEENVRIITISDLVNVPQVVKNNIHSIKDEPLKGTALRIFNQNVKIIVKGLQDNSISISREILKEAKVLYYL